jgi:hypothetical protein
MQQAWLDVPPRRRPAIPRRDLGIGVAMGVGLCAVAMAIVAGMELAPPPAADEPLTVSIGVLAKSGEPGAGRSGGSGRAKQPGKRRGRKTNERPPAGEPVAPRHPASGASALPPQPLAVPSPWDAPGGLPGLGDLGEPVEGPEDGDGGTGGGSGDGGTGDGGTGDGGLGAYRSQLASWLAAHFHVEGSGLGAKALRQLRVRAVLELSEDRVVTDYRFQPTGTPAVDEAARRALEAVKGQPIPAPPPSLGTLQRRINVVLTCRPETCD